MLRKLSLCITAILVVSNIVLAQDKKDGTKKFGYVGIDACGVCHKTEKQGQQLKIWKDSKHAQAFKTLQTAEADAIAKKMGHSTPAAQTEDCLKCHVSGYNVDASLKAAKFNMEDGVQCETCHGPGSEYKAMKIMKSREESVKNGLVIYDPIEKGCVVCHNPESPTYKEFKFEERWKEIKHNVPEK